MEIINNILASLHFNPVVFGFQVLFFTAFHFVMRTVIYDPLIKARNQRDGRIQGHLSRAEAAADNAQALKRKYEEEIRAHRQELSVRLREALEATEKEAAAKLEVARDEAGRIADEANRQLDEEEKQLKSSMEGEAQKLALSVATQVVRNTLSEGARDRVLAQLKG